MLRYREILPIMHGIILYITLHNNQYGILNFFIALLYWERQVKTAKQRRVQKSPLVTDRFCTRK
jgi:hypothetical protein